MCVLTKQYSVCGQIRKSSSQLLKESLNIHLQSIIGKVRQVPNRRTAVEILILIYSMVSIKYSNTRLCCINLPTILCMCFLCLFSFSGIFQLYNDYCAYVKRLNI